MMFDGLGSSAAHIKAGRIKALAVASDKRAPGFPDLPTTAELGLASYQVATWYGLWAPKGTPQGRGRAHPGRAAQGAQLRGARAPPGAASARPRPTCTARPIGRFVSSEVKRWAEVVKSSGAKLE